MILSSPRILIVDDQPESLSLLGRTLDSGSFDLRLAISGQDALAIIQGGYVPDLVLLDMRMPGMDGREFCLKLKAAAATRTIPVLFLSADDSLAQRSKAFEAGGVDYIPKPFSPEELLARIRIHLRLVEQELLIAEVERRKLIEQDLSRSQSLAHVGTWTLQGSPEALSWSKELYAIFDIPPETAAEDLYRLARERVHPEDQGLMETVSKALARGESVPAMEHRVVWRDGQTRYVWVEFGWTEGTNGKETRPWGVVLDVTDHRRSLQERARLERELEATRKFEALGRMAGGVAHTFNNMLLVVQGHTELGLAEVGDHPARERFGKIMAAMKRTQDITRQLMGFSRHQASQPAVLDLVEALANSMTLLGILVGDGVTLRWLPWPKPVWTRMDRAQLDQLMTNFCSNSRDAMQGKGVVEIEVEVCDFLRLKPETEPLPGPWARIAVRDHGSGISPEVRTHLFEPFYTTKARGFGTGLGLATNWGIVQQNGGHILAPSLPGYGACFEIYLPLVDAPCPPIKSPEAIQAPRADGCILVVDDEETIAELVRSFLRKAGWDTLVATDPRQALEIFRTHQARIDLVLSDVIMPFMDGAELVRRLRELQPNLPYVLMSGYTADVLSSRPGMDGSPLLEKPFSSGELLSTIHSVLEISRKTAAGT